MLRILKAASEHDTHTWFEKKDEIDRIFFWRIVHNVPEEQLREETEAWEYVIDTVDRVQDEFLPLWKDIGWVPTFIYQRGYLFDDVEGYDDPDDPVVAKGFFSPISRPREQPVDVA